MPEFICNTSPFQYLHQLGQLQILETLTGAVVAPLAVQEELDAGLAARWDVPDLRTLPWVTVREPHSTAALPLAADLGRGEASVLALALESKSPVVILDDSLARRAAACLGIQLTGTLGLLLDAKKQGLIPSMSVALDQLDSLRFRVSRTTRLALLKLAGEL